MKKNEKQTGSGGIESVYIDMATKKTAEELKTEIVRYGVPEELITVKRKQKSYRVTVKDGQNQIPKIIRMLASPEYGMSLEEIQTMFNIKITI